MAEECRHLQSPMKTFPVAIEGVTCYPCFCFHARRPSRVDFSSCSQSKGENAARMIVDALIIVLVPLVTFIAGARLMAAWTRRERVTRRLQQHAAPRDRKPLNQRLHYDLRDVQRHWSALDREALAAEKQF